MENKKFFRNEIGQKIANLAIQHPNDTILSHLSLFYSIFLNFLLNAHMKRKFFNYNLCRVECTRTRSQCRNLFLCLFIFAKTHIFI